jgi:hypothetical protein
MAHDWDIEMSWCKRCGRSRWELFENGPLECDGLKGVTHKRYRVAREAFEDMLAPIIKHLLGQ